MVLLSCVLWNDVLCSYRKTEEFGIMNRCLDCPQYKRFEAYMDAEDERVMDEIDRERAEMDAEKDAETETETVLDDSLQVCSGLEFCPHCRKDFSVLLSSDIGVRLHWVGDFIYFDVDLLFEQESATTVKLVSYGELSVLYREVYGLK